MLIQQVPAYLDYFGWPELAAALREPGSTLMDDVRRHDASPPGGLTNPDPSGHGRARGSNSTGR